MTEQIHDGELDTSERVIRSLLADQRPEWADANLTPIATTGTTNAMWRIRRVDEQDLVVRLPRTERAALGVERETNLLTHLAETSLVDTIEIPVVAHAGAPTASFPHRWAVLNWIGGDDAWSRRQELTRRPYDLVAGLVAAVEVISSLEDVPARERADGDRGGPLEPLLERLERWLIDPMWFAPDLVDVAAIRRSAAESAEVAGESATIGFVHGDLLPGNLLVSQRRLVAIIDWGAAGYGDTAQDLDPAWSVFEGEARRIFRESTDVDDATWLRARAFALEHAVGGVLYYAPRRHPLADVMARTLDHVLAD